MVLYQIVIFFKLLFFKLLFFSNLSFLKWWFFFQMGIFFFKYWFSFFKWLFWNNCLVVSHLANKLLVRHSWAEDGFCINWFMLGRKFQSIIFSNEDFSNAGLIASHFVRGSAFFKEGFCSESHFEEMNKSQ